MLLDDFPKNLPLNAIRVFEVAARLSSLSKAADELHVTAAAVNHQIRMLEEYLGIDLFRRQGTGVVLTEVGINYLEAISDSLKKIRLNTEQIRKNTSRRNLTIAAPLPIAIYWFYGKFASFIENNQPLSINLELTTNSELLNEKQDFAIFYGRTFASNLIAKKLIAAPAVIPVCAPALIGKGKPAHLTLAELKNFTLMEVTPHLASNDPGWRDWLLEAGVDDVQDYKIKCFGPRSAVDAAVIAGHGVGLLRTLRVAALLENGQLLKINDLALSTAASHYLVYRKTIAARKDAKALIKWIIAEALESEKSLPKNIVIKPLPKQKQFK